MKTHHNINKLEAPSVLAEDGELYVNAREVIQVMAATSAVLGGGRVEDTHVVFNKIYLDYLKNRNAPAHDIS